MPGSAGVQAPGEDEHAGGRGGEGALQVHPFCADQDQPADLYAKHGGDGPSGPGIHSF